MDSDDTTPELGSPARVFCVLAGIIWPVVCFCMVINSFPTVIPTWQTGKWIDILVLTLGGWPSWAFYPILAYSMLSLGFFVARERWARKQLWVRIGTYGGFLLAMMFAVVLSLVLSSLEMQGLAFFGLIGTVVVGVPVLLSTRRRPSIAMRLGMPTAEVSALLLATAGVVLFPVTIGFAFFFAPWLTASAFAIASLQLLRTSAESRFSIKALLLTVAWLSGLAACWRLAWLRALAIYAQLPTERPTDCFVVTAAAQGHPWVVGSYRVAGGTGHPVNRQLLRLKALELVLQAMCPDFHRRLRAAYNVVGPLVARRLKNRLLADAMYLLLKPLEFAAWLAEFALWLSDREQPVER